MSEGRLVWLRATIAAVSFVLTGAFVVFALAEPGVATPFGFVYMALLVALHAAASGLRRGR